MRASCGREPRRGIGGAEAALGPGPAPAAATASTSRPLLSEPGAEAVRAALAGGEAAASASSFSLFSFFVFPFFRSSDSSWY